MMIFIGILILLLKILSVVVLILLLLTVILCLSSVSAHISFWDGKFDWSIRYFGLKLLPRKKKEKKDAESEENDSSDDKKKDRKENQKETSKEKTENPFMDKIPEKLQKLVKRADMVSSALQALPSALRWLGRATTWYAIETDILIASEDAAECARTYGLVQLILQNLLGQAGNLIHVRRKSIRIRYDFIEDKSRYQFRCKVKINIGKTILAGIVFLWNYLKDSGQAKKAVVRPKL